MEYQIYTKKQITKSVRYPKKIKSDNPFTSYDITGLEAGKINLNDLKSVKWNNLISQIPESKMTELNKTGKTAFTVVTTQTVVLKK
ncbi:hypothetical protein [Chryseobacterium binzhouense]|uniref:hypothetical protein n=1 Tax=Chryseobacterium binzhouense TaxID=2593646 RepID=UPI00117CEB1B|nr:hypothetical protein [Chryseobacterium binzhouense]